MAFMMTANYSIFSLKGEFNFYLVFGYYIGTFFIENKVYNATSGNNYTIGDIISVLFSIVFASFALGAA